MGKNTYPPFPRAEKARLERAEDELTKKRTPKINEKNFASNLLKHTALTDRCSALPTAMKPQLLGAGQFYIMPLRVIQHYSDSE